MNILAIESSCDETAAAIISGDPFSPSPKPTLLSNVVVSQIDIFKAYGGVIPEVAARSHLEAILPVIHEATSTASKNSPEFRTRTANGPWNAIDAIAVTHTPGLLGSLLVGTLTTRTLAILHNKPLYAVHHLKSHIYANWLTDKPLPTFPLLALVVSGGHTQIIYMQEHNYFEIIGTTRDDAVGECFDKVAKILGLPYPGGPAITNAANGKITLSDTNSAITTNPGAPNKYHLPHPKIDGLDFSFSGLKTAVLRAVQKDCNVPINYPSHELKSLLAPTQIADFSASFEQTAVDILLDKLEQAKISHHTNNIVIAGGVSANQRLRETAKNRFPTENLFFPEPRFSGDNAAMVGAAAFYEIAKKVKPTDPYKLNIMPRSEIS